MFDRKYEKASLARRAIAAYIDYWIASIPFLIFNFVVHPMLFPSIGTTLFVQIPDMIIKLGYFTLMTYMNNGQTLGKMVLGTRVVSLKGKLSFNQIVTRYVILIVLLNLPMFFLFIRSNPFVTTMIRLIPTILIFVVIKSNKRYQGPHDIIAGTWVVKKKN